MKYNKYDTVRIIDNEHLNYGQKGIIYEYLEALGMVIIGFPNTNINKQTLMTWQIELEKDELYAD